MQHLSLFSSLFGLVAILGGSSAAHAQTALAQHLTVSRYGSWRFSISLTNAQADAMFSAANALTPDHDGSGTLDGRCKIGLFRSGDVFDVTGSGSDGYITDATEFDYVNALPGFVKVVAAIGYCGGVVAPNIKGCTKFRSRNSMIITEEAAVGAKKGVVVLHEFGHAVGLSDIPYNNESKVTKNFMLGFAEPFHNYILGHQCSALRYDFLDGDGPDQSMAALAVLSPSVAAPISGGDELDLSELAIEDLARIGFFEAPPADVEDYYGPDDLTRLKAMLTDSSEREHHGTIAALIGLLSEGSDADARILGTYVEAHNSSTAALSAQMSLGYVAERGSKVAMTMLTAAAAHGAALRDVPPLASAAIAGLGLSARTEGLRQLRALRARSPGRALLSGIDEALRAGDTIAAKGRRGYYAR
jgi:hypothetical protein